jgi:UTP--glucose-1-phosphate uridylyltransferase
MAHRIRKAVFPVAGLGTRVLPATKTVPKEMLTVVDRPVLQHVGRRGARGGHRAFRLRHRPQQGGDRGPFRHGLRARGHAEARGKTKELEALMADLPAAGATSFTRQQAPLGLGHAVWCARDIVGDEPFAVLLPDMITLPGARGSRCLQQCIDTPMPGTAATSSLWRNVPPGGRAHVRHRLGRQGFRTHFEISGMVEKPAKGTAPSNLIISGRYVLQPGNLLDPRKGRERRGRRNPAHRRHDHAAEGPDPSTACASTARPTTPARRSDSSPPTSPSRWPGPISSGPATVGAEAPLSVLARSAATKQSIRATATDRCAGDDGVVCRVTTPARLRPSPASPSPVRATVRPRTPGRARLSPRTRPPSSSRRRPRPR